MDIVEVAKERDLADYDFMFISGAKLVVTIEEAIGDSVTEHPDRFVIEIKPKPVGFTAPEEKTDEETLTVFKTGLAAMNVCKRKQREPTENEIFEMNKTLHKMSKLVQ